MEHETFVKILFELQQDEDGYPPASVEGIWAVPVGDGYRIDNIPFYVRGIGPGDIVSANNVDDQLWFDSLVSSSGASVYRFLLTDINDLDSVRTLLLDQGCPAEVNAKIGMISVEVPASKSMREFARFMLEQHAKGVLDFQEGVLRHELPEEYT